MSSSNAPKRAYTLTIDIGADTFDDLIGLLSHAIYTLHRGSTNVTSGGYSSGGSWELRHDPEMTHERYIDLLNAYLEGAK